MAFHYSLETPDGRTVAVRDRGGRLKAAGLSLRIFARDGSRVEDIDPGLISGIVRGSDRVLRDPYFDLAERDIAREGARLDIR